MDRPREDRTATILRGATRFPIAVRVRVVGAPATPPTFRLAQGTCVVGAGTEADIIIDHPTVSRRHLELALVAEGVQLVDLGSRNGTFYLGQRAERMTLALGSRIRVGPAELLLEADEEALAAREGDGPEEYQGMLARSPAMRQLFAKLTRLEGSVVNILVQGESGVGKELIARAIHQGSALSSCPFVTLNAGALPRELIASELFGHKKGAFTGAIDTRRGAFERADGGTLFLDEIGELPLDVQPMLLRALESGEIRALGDDHPKRVKVRIVAATNRVLAEEVRAGRFREDLYFRLAVVTLAVPPLRERPEDIPLLARRFAAVEGVTSLPEDMLRDLSSRSFPGNVRELKNAVQAYLALGDLPSAGSVGDGGGADLERGMKKAIDFSRPYAEQKDEVAGLFTRVYLEALLKKTGGNQTEAARIAGMDRGYLGKLLAKYGLGRPG
jgi:transcriptional regulator with GAF, ATPase, and Fis domain